MVSGFDPCMGLNHQLNVHVLPVKLGTQHEILLQNAAVLESKTSGPSNVTLPEQHRWWCTARAPERPPPGDCWLTDQVVKAYQALSPIAVLGPEAIVLFSPTKRDQT